MTNGDRMRTCSDREIAAILHGDYCISSFGGTAECVDDGEGCYDCWVWWLQQEVNDEHID